MYYRVIDANHILIFQSAKWSFQFPRAEGPYGAYCANQVFARQAWESKTKENNPKFAEFLQVFRIIKQAMIIYNILIFI